MVISPKMLACLTLDSNPWHLLLDSSFHFTNTGRNEIADVVVALRWGRGGGAGGQRLFCTQKTKQFDICENNFPGSYKGRTTELSYWISSVFQVHLVNRIILFKCFLAAPPQNGITKHCGESCHYTRITRYKKQTTILGGQAQQLNHYNNYYPLLC